MLIQALRTTARRAVHSSAARFSAVKPGSESEQTIPGQGSTEDIAHSSGAYEGDKPNPDSASNKIKHESGETNMDQSAANKSTSDTATQSQHKGRPTKQEQKIPSRSDHKATRARKQS